MRRASYFAVRTESARTPCRPRVRCSTCWRLPRRADLKSELLQELDRQRQSLEALARQSRDRPGSAGGRAVGHRPRAVTRMLSASGKVGQELRDNEWLMSIKQRTAIPGGACAFDLPSYHYWLNQDAESRRADLKRWMLPFEPICDGFSIVLRLLRESGKTSQQVALRACSS